MEGGIFIISFIYKADRSFEDSIDMFLIQLMQNIAVCSVFCLLAGVLLGSIQCLDLYSPLDLGGRTARSLQRNV